MKTIHWLFILLLPVLLEASSVTWTGSVGAFNEYIPLRGPSSIHGGVGPFEMHSNEGSITKLDSHASNFDIPGRGRFSSKNDFEAIYLEGSYKSLPGMENLEWVGMGKWKEDSEFGQKFKTSTGYITFGNKDNLTTTEPANQGAAVYEGKIYATVLENGKEREVQGTISTQIDWETSTLFDMKISLKDAADFTIQSIPLNKSENLTFRSNTTTQWESANSDSSIRGMLYGPNGEEIGGVLYAETPNSYISGAFFLKSAN